MKFSNPVPQNRLLHPGLKVKESLLRPKKKRQDWGENDSISVHKRRGNSSSNESDFSCYWRGGPHVLTWPLGHVKFAISRMFYRVSSIRILKWMWTHQFSFCNSIVIFIKIIHLHVSRNPVSRKSSTLLKASSRVHHPSLSHFSVWPSVNCKDVGVSVEELPWGRGSAGEASPIWCDGDERPALYPLDPERTSGLFLFF